MPYRMVNGFPVWGEHDEGTIRQLMVCAREGDAAAAALMADGHRGYSQPVGGVVAYEKYLSPSGVGYDIACGNKAVRTNLRWGEIRHDLPRIMGDLVKTISFGIGRKNPRPVDHPVLEDPLWKEERELAALHGLARQQLGTVGGGNHYVDLLVEVAQGVQAGALEGANVGVEPPDDAAVWVACHFGSRGVGFKIATGYLNLAHGRPFDAPGRGESMDQPPTLIRADSELGQSYAAAMELAGRFAYAGRDIVIDEVLRLLGARSDFAVHNHHNYCVPQDAVIWGPEGAKRLSDVRVGDWVYALDARRGLVPAKVAAITARGIEPLRVIRTPHRCLRVTGDHLVLTLEFEPRRLRRRWRWKAARELRVGDLVVCANSRYRLSEAAGWQPGAYGTRPVQTAVRRRVACRSSRLLLPGVRIERILAVGQTQLAVPVYDLAVDHPSHNFVCEGVVVHNCWREEHGGRKLWVVRKGATPLWPGQLGFVGGSMGDVAVVVRGVDSEEARRALYSTIHGAGRVMSRTQAAGKWRKVKGRRVRVGGAVDMQAVRRRLAELGIELRGGGPDEAPAVYRPLVDVLRYHAPTLEVLYVLRPVGVAMAAPEEEDPYKD